MNNIVQKKEKLILKKTYINNYTIIKKPNLINNNNDYECIKYNKYFKCFDQFNLIKSIITFLY